MEKEILSLIDRLFQLDNAHEEISLNGNSAIIDMEKVADNVIKVTITKKDNKEKKEFENWVTHLDDDIFEEVWESLSEEYGLKDLNDLYESENYSNVISLFKERVNDIISAKIKELQSYLN